MIVTPDSSLAILCGANFSRTTCWTFNMSSVAKKMRERNCFFRSTMENEKLDDKSIECSFTYLKFVFYLLFSTLRTVCAIKCYDFIDVDRVILGGFSPFSLLFFSTQLTFRLYCLYYFSFTQWKKKFYDWIDWVWRFDGRSFRKTLTLSTLVNEWKIWIVQPCAFRWYVFMLQCLMLHFSTNFHFLWIFSNKSILVLFLSHSLKIRTY